MAIAVIGGLITSTGLTLVMVPAVFCWIDDLEQWVGRRLARSVLSSGVHEAHLDGNPAALEQ